MSTICNIQAICFLEYSRLQDDIIICVTIILIYLKNSFEMWCFIHFHIRFYAFYVSIVQNKPNDIKTMLSRTMFPRFYGESKPSKQNKSDT